MQLPNPRRLPSHRLPCAQERLEASHRFTRRLKGELMGAENEARRFMAARREVEADLSELHALVADAESATGSVQKLEGLVGHLSMHWRECLKGKVLWGTSCCTGESASKVQCSGARMYVHACVYACAYVSSCMLAMCVGVSSYAHACVSM